jgi:hypothetical protein
MQIYWLATNPRSVMQQIYWLASSPGSFTQQMNCTISPTEATGTNTTSFSDVLLKANMTLVEKM